MCIFIGTNIYFKLTWAENLCDFHGLDELFWSKHIHCCWCCRQHPNFSSFSPEPWSQIQTYRAQSIFQIHSLFNEPEYFPRGDNNEVMILDVQVLKIFSRTTWPISTKHGIKHPLVKRFKFAQINYSILKREKNRF